MNDLLQRHCTPQSGPPMDPDAVQANLATLEGWQRRGDAIEKTYTFKNYHRTMAFVNALAWICHAEDHHPELVVHYGDCSVRFDTHTVGGISINDFICAAKIDALLHP